jgi:hypothetical protein
VSTVPQSEELINSLKNIFIFILYYLYNESFLNSTLWPNLRGRHRTWHLTLCILWYNLRVAHVSDRK